MLRIIPISIAAGRNPKSMSMQGLQPKDWWDLHHEINYPLFGTHVSTAVLIPPTPRQLSDATTVDTGSFV